MDEHERAIRRLRLDDRERREEVEAAEFELDRATRRLIDVFHDAGRRGACVLVELANHTVRGTAMHAGVEAVVLRGDRGESTLVVLTAIEGIDVDEDRATGAGPVTTGHPATLVAWLRGVADERPEVEVFRLGSEPVRGRLAAVTSDHLSVEMRSGRERLVPLTAVSAVGDLRGVGIR